MPKAYYAIGLTVNPFGIIIDPMSLTLREQLRAARSLVGWSQAELAEKSGVSLPTIKRVEVGAGPLEMRLDTVRKLQAALETAGVIFVASNGDGPGVRLAKGKAG
jgi:transcriptional regulator with XRE-family HTH domain